MLRRRDEGWILHWLLVTNGQHADGEGANNKRDQEIQAVADAYGFTEVFRLDLPVSELHLVPETELYYGISSAIRETHPTELLLPFRSDAHSDHHAVNAIGWSCSKSFRFPSVLRVLMYDTPSETEFHHPGDPFEPNVLIDISGYLDRKLEIMSLYESELKKHPFPRSEEALRARATLYGAMAGCSAAEGFMLMREIDLKPD